MSDTFQLTPVQLGTPSNNLIAEIGLTQAEIMAISTTVNPEVMFGRNLYQGATLEIAVAMQVAITGPTESLRWVEA